MHFDCLCIFSCTRNQMLLLPNFVFAYVALSHNFLFHMIPFPIISLSIITLVPIIFVRKDNLLSGTSHLAKAKYESVFPYAKPFQFEFNFSRNFYFVFIGVLFVSLITKLEIFINTY